MIKYKCIECGRLIHKSELKKVKSEYIYECNLCKSKKLKYIGECRECLDYEEISEVYGTCHKFLKVSGLMPGCEKFK